MKYDNSSIKQSILASLEKYYGIILKSLDFKPVGEESYSYLAIDSRRKKYFVKYCERAKALKFLRFSRTVSNAIEYGEVFINSDYIRSSNSQCGCLKID